MKTFLIVLLVVLGAWLAFHFLPVVIGLLLVGGIFLTAIGACSAGGFALAAGLGLTIAGALVVAGFVTVAVLAPLWFPVLAFVGLFVLAGKLFGGAAN